MGSPILDGGCSSAILPGKGIGWVHVGCVQDLPFVLALPTCPHPMCLGSQSVLRLLTWNEHWTSSYELHKESAVSTFSLSPWPYTNFAWVPKMDICVHVSGLPT